MTCRPGVTLAEAVIALALGALLLAAVGGLAGGVSRLARLHDDRVEALETVRIASVVLTRELRFLDPGADLMAVARDSVRLRVIRGTGIACGTAGGGVLVRYRGLRRPNPEKDSVLVIDAAGRERAGPLRGLREAPDGCPTDTGAVVYAWRLDTVPPAGTPLLLYETGAYHLADRAFRYRRGLEGRQPLTALRLDDRAGGFRLSAGLRPDADRAAGAPVLEAVLTLVPADASLENASIEQRRRVRIAFLNGLDTAPESGE